jgi:excisionase family DNA binding protein
LEAIVERGMRLARGTGYLTLQEAAEQLRCSTKTVRRYVACGRLTAYRVGPTMLRVSAEQLDAMVVAGEVPAVRPA